MPKYAANLSMLFTELPFMARFEAVAHAGFSVVEFWWPDETAREGLDLRGFAQRVREIGLQVALVNIDAGDMAAGDRGLAGLPERSEEFRAAVPRAIELARALGCKKLNALAGNAASVDTRSRQLDVLKTNVAWAADLCIRDGISVMIEALNGVDTPLYLVQGTNAALELIARTNRPNVGYQLDVYHAAMNGEDVVGAIRDAAGTIGHVQFADCPGRHEPGTGVLPFSKIISALEAVGYRDPIGLEYKPSRAGAPDFSFLAGIEGQPTAA